MNEIEAEKLISFFFLHLPGSSYIPGAQLRDFHHYPYIITFMNNVDFEYVGVISSLILHSHSHKGPERNRCD